MTDYEMNWQADSAKEELELLKAKVKYFEDWLDSPMISCFYIINQVIVPKYKATFS